MKIPILIFNQIIMMFLLMLIGNILFRTKKLTRVGTQQIGTLILYVVLPSLIINHFNQPFTQDRMHKLWISGAIGLLSLVISMLVAHLSLGRDKGIERFSVAFSNAGFFGIPIVQAIWGEEAVFYIIFTIALLNIFQWIYGVYAMTLDKKTIEVRRLIKNPVIIATLIGLILFHFPVTLPTMITKGLSLVSGMNTPLGMIVLGVYLAETSLKELFLDIKLYKVVVLRLVIIPLILLITFKFLPSSWKEISSIVFVVSATPVGSNVAIMAQKFNCDTKKSVQYIVLSTLISIITLPFLVYFF